MEKKTNMNGHGGARQGAGRPKGSTNKIKMEDLLANIEQHTGQDYAQQLASNYAAAIVREDWRMVNDYDKAFLNKVVADKTEVEVIDSEDAIETRAQAFAEALTALVAVNKKDAK